MRKIAVFGTLLLSAALTGWAQGGEDQKSETLLRWHFAGTKQVANLKDLETFRQALALPETAALRDAAAQHIARRAAARFTKGGNTNAHAEIIKLIQPLLPDLWQNESSFHMTTGAAQDADWILAVKLDGNRSGEWNRTLAQLAKAAGMQGAGATRGATTFTKENYRLTLSREKDWTVLEGGFGNPDPKIARAFRSDLGKRRGKRLLTAEANSPLLAKLWKSETLAEGPKMTLEAEAQKDGIRTEMMMAYAEDIGIKAEKWNVPTDLIRDPLIGFTAIQGVARKLATLEKFKALGAQQTPNQLFFWAQRNSPFSISMAADVKNPAQVVTNVSGALREVKMPMGVLRASSNQPAVLWEGLPMVKPKLEAAPAPRDSFLMARMFPVDLSLLEPAPPELFKQLNKRNLVYYDWEVTGYRMKQYGPFWQLYYLLGGKPTLVESPSMKWLAALAPMLGNTVTQGTLEGRREIKLVRHSQLGLNSIELLLLAHLVDDTDVVAQRRLPTPTQQLQVPPSTPR